MKKKNILYFYTSRSSFVSGDIEFLSEKYTVHEYKFSPRPTWTTPWALVKQFFFLVVNLGKTNLILCMFGGYHSFLPSVLGRVTGKKCLVIAGGTDCVSFPSIGYGNFRKGFLAHFTRWSYRYCSMILPVHKSLVEYDYSYDDKDFPKQGYNYFCPGLTTPSEEINYGYDPGKWIKPMKRIPGSFITVAAGLADTRRIQLKGIDLILEAAAHFPDSIFTIVGCPEGYSLPVKSKNIRVHSFLTDEELKEQYNSHEFYIQASMSEGFPNAICEAMLCGCIPIGSAVGGIRDIIGESGFILFRKDIQKFIQLIQTALGCNKEEYSHKASSRMKEKYPKNLRKDKLMALLESI